MNKRQFMYFLEVYKYKNFQTAADHLMISRQGLSKMIIDLEKELQQPLFFRTSKGLEPTKYAILLVPHIQKILDEFDFLEGKNSLLGLEKKVINIYAIQGFLEYLTVDFLTEFHITYPQFILNITEAPDSVVLEKLNSSSIELAILLDPIDFNLYNAEPIIESHYCIVANTEHPISQKEYIHYTDMQGQQTIGRGREWICYQRNVNKVLQKGIYMDILIEISNEEMMHKFIEKNIAFAYSFDFMACRHVCPNTKIIPIAESDAWANVYITEKTNSLLSRETLIFKNFLKNWIKTHHMEKVYLQ